MIPIKFYIVQNGELTPPLSRSCAGCGVCCEGALYAEINGFEIGGKDQKPCMLLDRENKKCSDYKWRPQLCRDFQCEWLVNEDIPEHLKPSITNNLVVRYTIEDITYLYIAHLGDNPKQEVIEWMLDYCTSKNLNLAWWYNGKIHLYGTDQWFRMMKYIHNADAVRFVPSGV